MSAISVTLSSKISQRRNWINGLALVYVVAGYSFSVVCISSQFWTVNILGVLLLIHTLMWAAYFVHELVHGTVFRRPGLNAPMANMMLFLTGSCYCRFRDLARNHLAHHKNRADFSAFSIANFLMSLPKPLMQLIVVLEWLYFPAVNFILRWFCALAPFFGQTRRDERWQNAGLLLRESVYLLYWDGIRGDRSLSTFSPTFASSISCNLWIVFSTPMLCFNWGNHFPNTVWSMKKQTPIPT